MILSVTQHAFTTGKVGASVIGRTDVEPMASGLLELDNAFATIQGPVDNRTGTEFIGETKFADKPTIIEQFTFSVTQTMILEIGPQYIRFWLDGGQIVKEYSAWLTATDYEVGDLITEAGNYYRCVDAHTSGVFATDLDALNWELSQGASDLAYEVRTPWTEFDIPNLSLATAGDVIYITSGKVNTRKLTRLDNDSWTLEVPEFIRGPFQPVNEDPEIMMAFNASGTVINAYDQASNSIDFFLDEHIGQYLRIQVAPTELVPGATCTALIDSFPIGQVAPHSTVEVTIVHGDHDKMNSLGERSQDWRFGYWDRKSTTNNIWRVVQTIDPVAGNKVWTYAGIQGGGYKYENNDFGPVITIAFISAQQRWYGSGPSGHSPANDDVSTLPYPPQFGWFNSVNDEPLPEFSVFPSEYNNQMWPRKAMFHQDRLVLYSALNAAQIIWMSINGFHEYFDPVNEFNEVLDDSAIQTVLSGGIGVDFIEWIVSVGSAIALGTSSEEFKSITAGRTDPLTPKNITLVPQSRRGSSPNQNPQLADEVLVFIQRLGETIRGMQYNVVSDKDQSVSLTKYADDICSERGGAIKMSHVPEPNSTIYFTTASGDIVVLVLAQEEKVQAFSILEPGFVLSTAVIPSSSNYDVYCLVRRTINGQTKQYLERFSPVSSDANYWSYLDSSIEYHDDITPITEATNINHLEGETVTIFADGQKRGTAIVASGQVSLGGSYNHVIIGLPYVTRIRLLPIEGSLQSGSTNDKRKRTVEIVATTVEPTTIKIGLTEEDAELVPQDEDDQVIHVYEPEEDFTYRAGDFYLIHDEPTPFSLATVTRKVEFRD